MAIDTQERTTGRTLARWTKLGVLGQLFVASGALLMALAIVAFGLEVEGEQTFLAIVAAIALAGAACAWRLGLAGRIIGIVTSVLPAMALFWTAFGFGAFPSFFDFMPAVLVAPGAILAVVSYISAIVASRRGNRTERAAGGERTAIRVAFAVVGVVAVVTGALTITGRSTVDAGRADETVTMSGLEFDAAAYRFDPGTTLLVRNDDPFLHTFTVDALGIDVTMGPGDEVLVDIPNRPGAYALYCRPHTETPDEPEYGSDMAARLTIG
jgi:plastocyanin